MKFIICILHPFLPGAVRPIAPCTLRPPQRGSRLYQTWCYVKVHVENIHTGMPCLCLHRQTFAFSLAFGLPVNFDPCPLTYPKVHVAPASFFAAAFLLLLVTFTFSSRNHAHTHILKHTQNQTNTRTHKHALFLAIAIYIYIYIYNYVYTCMYVRFTLFNF